MAKPEAASTIYSSSPKLTRHDGYSQVTTTGRNYRRAIVGAAFAFAFAFAGIGIGMAWVARTQSPYEYSYGYFSWHAQEQVSNFNLCRCMPDDDCWPTVTEWSQFNASVGGRLERTNPIGSPCHDPAYDEERCSDLKEQWTSPSLHHDSSHSIMAPFFANRSCDPFTPREKPCEMGNYVEYSLRVGNPAHISSALAFATEKNVRLVIRNTGHDYIGRSTGPGSLAIWTHYLKDIELFDYHDAFYIGKAMKIGAGVQAFEAYEAADKLNFSVVGGECVTVGLAGGYTQGGGHSALASKYGLAADQTLEWEVVDGTGQLRRASRSENSDLYWALSGGGGGNFGVVYSLTFKVHPNIPITGVNLRFAKKAGRVAESNFWDAVEYFHTFVHRMSDVDGMVIYVLTSKTFDIMPLTMPGKSKREVEYLLGPFLAKLSQLSITYEFEIHESFGYLAHHDAMFWPMLVGIAQYGGRLIPQSTIKNNTTLFTQAVREIVSDGVTLFGIGLNVSSSSLLENAYNAVLPSWRRAGISAVLASPWSESSTWEERLALQGKMTNEWIPKITALSPDSGCYQNEGDFQELNWKKTFFGVNYDRLLAVKQKYDPGSVFYAHMGVGSDIWKVEAGGRLCKA